jgi:hypothetical protein
MNRLTPEERQHFRNTFQKTRDQRKASSGPSFSAREVLEGYDREFPLPVQRALKAVVLRDEMGPGVGEDPPDFFLKRMGPEERVRLSNFRGQRPVALVFGSYLDPHSAPRFGAWKTSTSGSGTGRSSS